MVRYKCAPKNSALENIKILRKMHLNFLNKNLVRRDIFLLSGVWEIKKNMPGQSLQSFSQTDEDLTY